MHFKEYREKVIAFFKGRDWYEYNIFIRTNFLTEEVGELAQIIRKIEIGRDRPDENLTSDNENYTELKEEIGDVLNNLIIIADKYDIDFEEIYEANKSKMEERFSEE